MEDDRVVARKCLRLLYDKVIKIVDDKRHARKILIANLEIAIDHLDSNRREWEQMAQIRSRSGRCDADWDLHYVIRESWLLERIAIWNERISSQS